MRRAGVLSLNGRFLVAACLTVFASSAFPQATIEGTVKLPKTAAGPVMAKRYEIVSTGGVLSPSPPVAIVYLEGSFPEADVPAVRHVIQTNYAFVPALLAVRVGTKVEFPNHDASFHNIFSYSPAKRFDLGRYRPEDRPIPWQVFDKPGLVTLRCDIHEHMRGLILVLDTPYFVTTDPQGRFALAGLPEGSYVLKAWIDSRTTLKHSVRLTNGATLKIDLPATESQP